MLLISVQVVESVVAQNGLVVFVSSDTEWAKSSSPYNLSGPTVVNPGVTLTIDSGVTVNLNGYTLFINGTIKALGTTLDNIQISGSNITFGASTSGLSRFENTIINAPILGNSTVTFSNDKINNATTVGDSSLFSGCMITASLTAGKAVTISNSDIQGDISLGDFSTLTGNTITGDVTTGNSASITHNIISGSKYQNQAFGGFYYTIALTVGSQSTITGNTISGGATAVSSSVSGNIISGGARFTDWVGRSEDATSALTVKGASSVTSNAIFSNTGGYGLLIEDGPTTVSGNSVNNSIRIAGKAVVDGNFVIGGIQVGDIYISAFNEIDYGSGNATVINNICSGSYYGIFSSYAGGTASIQNNLIANCTYGIKLVSNATIQGNTIYGSSTAISLTGTSPLINYNNILSYGQNSVLMSSNPVNVNATYNWWGTTDIQAIGLSIHDFKYDLNLGIVNIQPILTSLNLQAPSISYALQVPSLPSVTQTPTPTSTIASTLPSPSATVTTAGSTENPNPTTAGQTAVDIPSPTKSIPEYLALTILTIMLLSTVLAVSPKLRKHIKKSAKTAETNGYK